MTTYITLNLVIFVLSILMYSAILLYFSKSTMNALNRRYKWLTGINRWANNMNKWIVIAIKKSERLIAFLSLALTCLIIYLKVAEEKQPTETAAEIFGYFHFALELFTPLSLTVLFGVRIIAGLSDPMKRFFAQLTLVINDSIDQVESNGKSHQKIETIFSASNTTISIVEVTKENLEDLHDIAETGWGNSTLTVAERNVMYTSWFNKNPDTFTLFYDHDKVIGYLAVPPLNNDVHFTGHKNKFAIHESDIADWGFQSIQPRYVYFEGIYILPEYQENPDIVNLVYATLLKKIYLAMGNGISIVYADANYPILKNVIKKVGFGEAKPLFPDSKALYVPFYERKKITALTDREVQSKPYETYYMKGKCGEGQQSNFLFHTMDYIRSQIGIPTEEASIDDVIHQHAVTCIAENDIKKLTNTMFLLSFHSTVLKGKNSNRMEKKNHHLSSATMRFSIKPGKTLRCELVIFSKIGKGCYYRYIGNVHSANQGKELMVTLHPISQAEKPGKWIPYQGVPYPITVRGNFPKHAMEPVLFTYYSFQTKTHRAKVALMIDLSKADMKRKAECLPLVLKESDKPDLAIVKKFLMKESKVSISTIELPATGGIKAWMDERFKVLGITESKKYLLMYFKLDGNNVARISHAEIEFYNNGIGKVTRNYCFANTVFRTDTYYGDVNKYHTEPIIYIKPIQLNYDEASNEIHQEYRELFIEILKPKVPEFDFTVGIIAGDKDKENGISKNELSATVCVLCNINQNFIDCFATGDPFTNFAAIEGEASRFLAEVVEGCTKKSAYSIDLTSDDAFFKYATYFKADPI